MPAPAMTPTAMSPNASPSRRCAWSRSLVRPTVRAMLPAPLASRCQPPRRPRPTARVTDPFCAGLRAGGRRAAGRVDVLVVVLAPDLAVPLLARAPLPEPLQERD